jgi:predicted transglutaminase-like cysteine proteinase
MKRNLLVAAVLTLSVTTSSVADPLLVSVKATPYDRQMSRIRRVLASAHQSSSDRVSLLMVNGWMSELRDVPYQYKRTWQTPGEVDSGRAADCKGKAVALYRRMKTHGATNLRLVIGRRTPWSPATHAWLEWKTPRGKYVLDPTFNSRATSSAHLGSRSYTPLYAYAGSRKFRAGRGFAAQR